METDKSDNDKTEAESSEDEKYEPQRTARKAFNSKRRRSIAWRFCDRENEVIASCKICKLKMSYRSTVSNLTKHARVRHPEFFHKVCEDLKSGNTTEDADISPDWDRFEDRKRLPRVNTREAVYHDKSGSDDPVWRYFTLLDKTLKIASCTICSKRINYCSLVDLLHHIKKKHNDQYIPGKNVTLLVTDDDQLFEVETIDSHKEETLDNTDHLQGATNDGYESPDISDDFTPPKKRVKFISPQKIKRDVPIKIFHKPTPKVPETTLDYFGKYLMSLMKELPEHVSNKLQADFIRQAIDAKSNDSTPTCTKISIIPEAVSSFNIPYTSETEVRNECDQ